MKPASDLTLLHLLSKNRAKMEKAFNKIYEDYSYLVFYVSFEIVKDKEAAKDITNETFMKFYENRTKFTKIRELKYYLVKTAKNLSINYVYSLKKTVFYDDDISGVEDKRDDFNEYIEKFSKFLDKEELDLLIYRFLYGFTLNEIANEKRVSINSVSSKFRRTMEKVKKHYLGEQGA